MHSEIPALPTSCLPLGRLVLCKMVERTIPISQVAVRVVWKGFGMVLNTEEVVTWWVLSLC